MAILAQMVMELAWIVPWYRSLTMGTYSAEPWRVLVFFFLVMQINFWLSRGMNALNIHNRYRRVVLGVGLAACSLLGLRFLLYFSSNLTLLGLVEQPIRAFGDVLNLIPDEFVVVVAVLLVSYRGVAIASQHISPADMLFRFKVGFGMLVLFILMNTLLTGEVPGNFLFLFIFSGLIAIGAARMAVSEKLRGGSRSVFDRRWAVGMIGGAFFFVLMSFMASQITTQPIFEFLIRILALIGSLLLGIVLLLLTPVMLLIIGALTWLMMRLETLSALPNLISDLQQMINSLSRFAGQLVDQAAKFLPDLSASKPILLWSGLAGIFVLGLLLLSISWLVRNYAEIQSDEVDGLLENGDLIKFIRRVFLRNIKNLGRQIDEGLNHFRRDRRLAAARIRQIYQQLMAVCQDLGVSKADAATPLEFLPRMVDIFPGYEAELERITAAYNKVRYGELPEDLTELQLLETDWQNLQTDANSRMDKQSN
ncbi:MAG: DUF4129 domain-containing protein [Anaerolineales bacterium]